MGVGDKLIDHLKHWLDPVEVSGGSTQVAWAPGEQPAVASAILELFHLLPNQSSAKFMETEGPMLPSVRLTENESVSFSMQDIFPWNRSEILILRSCNISIHCGTIELCGTSPYYTAA